jgi:hypothetical protein
MAEYPEILIRQHQRYNGFVRTRLRMRVRIGCRVQAIRSESMRPFAHTDQRGASLFAAG